MPWSFQMWLLIWLVLLILLPSLEGIKYAGSWPIYALIVPDVAFDLISPANLSSKGYIWILAATECYSKWVELMCLKWESGAIVGSIIRYDIIYWLVISKISLTMTLFLLTLWVKSLLSVSALSSRGHEQDLECILVEWSTRNVRYGMTLYNSCFGPLVPRSISRHRLRLSP